LGTLGLVAVAFGQAPENANDALITNDDNDNLLFTAANDKSIVSEVMEMGAIRKVVNETMTHSDFSAAAMAEQQALTQQLDQATTEINRLSQLIAQSVSNAQGRSPIADQVNRLASQVSGETSAFVTYSARNNRSMQSVRSQVVGARSDLSSMAAVARTSITQSVQSQNVGIISQAQATFDSTVSQMDVLVANDMSRLVGNTVAATSRSLAALNVSISRQIAPYAVMASAMANTHFMHPETPFYRWMMYHVYSNNGVGWFDGNNPRFFGGRHPSQWGDGNTNVWDMHSDIRYMARLFTRRGVGTQGGATVCSETWYLYSSTDTKYCIALFRIKNTQTRTIGWRTNWYGTGWSGWGNYQTATMNAQQRWGGSCTWWCHRGYTWNIPSNSNRNRVSTVIFANGMCHPNHYADNHHIETTFLGFDGLQLPNGLEYIDDMDTASGRWR